MRTRFMAVHAGRRAAARSKRELRNHANVPLQEEAHVLDKVFSGAAEGQVLVVPQLKPLIDQKLGKTLSLSSIYRMLARDGWRKLAPDTAHPQGVSNMRRQALTLAAIFFARAPLQKRVGNQHGPLRHMSPT